MKNIFTLLFVVFLASCGTTQTNEEEVLLETDSTTLQTLEVPLDTTVVDTTVVDTLVSE